MTEGDDADTLAMNDELLRAAAAEQAAASERVAASQPPSPPPPGARGPAPAEARPPEPPPPALTPAPPLPPRTNERVTEVQNGPSMGVRALWFIFVGWWLTGIVSAFAWVAMVTIIGLPLGIWLINRIPTVITLRPRTTVRYQYTDHLGRIVTHDLEQEQPHWAVRGLWFVFVGWWASAIAMTVGWVLIVLLITLPIGLWIYNRIPFIASLYRY